MKRVMTILALVCCGCCADNPPPTTQHTNYLHDKKFNHLPYGFSIYTYKGNEYIVVKGVECVSICPALPPKAEKEPGHAE